jgi:hypothetical protein
MSCAGKPAAIPNPVRLSFPNWAVAEPNKMPRVLELPRLKTDAPGWHARVQFPALGVRIEPPDWYARRQSPPFGVKMEPPGWYRGVSFQPLKDSK